MFIQQALCAESMGNVDEALNNFLRAASLDNTNPLVLKKIGIVANAGDKKLVSDILKELVKYTLLMAVFGIYKYSGGFREFENNLSIIH